MEGILKDLDKLDSRIAGDAVTAETVQAGIDALERWRDALMAGDADGEDDGMQDGGVEESEAAEAAMQQIHACSSRLTESNKEWFSAMTKFGKSVDKKFTADLSPLLPTPPAGANSELEDDSHLFFASEESIKTIDNVIAMHLVRSGDEEALEDFLEESGVSISPDDSLHFATLQSITSAIAQGDLSLAFQWVQEHRDYLHSRQSVLEYHLHRSQYVRLLLSDSYPLPPALEELTYVKGLASSSSTTIGSASTAATQHGARRALNYARLHFKQFYPDHKREISRLSASAIYLPISRLLSSPYMDLFCSTPDEQRAFGDASKGNPTDEIYHAPHLINLFSSEFCTSLNMSKDLPLKVVTDIGGGESLAKIAKVRSVMKDKRTEWSTAAELPVEIPVPQEYRYHSIFACPVSKEQATPSNPPMMMPCGHTVAKQTLMKLCKGGQNVRCPYCPLSSAVNQAIQLTF